MNETKQPNPKREKLIEHSKSLKQKMRKGDPTFAECETVNDCLRLLYASDTGQTEFDTFKGWKEKGFSVNKGEHGFPVWGRPRKFTKEVENGEDKEFSAFPLATIFHKGQVSPSDEKPIPAKPWEEETPRPIKEDDKPSAKAKLAEKLLALVHSMKSEIAEKLDPAIAQQNPTPRRLRIAAGIRAEGEVLELAREILIANASNLLGNPPLAWVGELDVAESMGDCLTKKAAVTYANRFKDEIISAMRRAGMAKEDDGKGEVQRMINELCGCKIDGFFPTPDKIAGQMAELAELEGATSLLEPSAGYGALIDAARRANVGMQVTAFEVNHKLADILNAKKTCGVVHRADFLDHASTQRWDRIMMNPPFEKGQDMMHVMTAFDKLTAGGILVSIVCENCFYRTDGDYPLFREWLDDLGAEVIELPAGAFTGTIRTTNVKTRIIKIKKPS